MNNEKCENKTINEKDEIINKQVLNPSSFELVQKVDLSFLIPNYSKIIHELSSLNLGILLEKKLIIISQKTFKTIKIIKPSIYELKSNHDTIGYEFVDFIELKNCNIILWTSNVILIYNKEYNLIQRIDESEHGNICVKEDSDYGSVTYYDINSIFEMKNGKLVSCNSY